MGRLADVICTLNALYSEVPSARAGLFTPPFDRPFSLTVP